MLQFTREAHFTGDGYLGLQLADVPDVQDNFYAGVGFRTEHQDGLMFYHQGQVQTGSFTCLMRFLLTDSYCDIVFSVLRALCVRFS